MWQTTKKKKKNTRKQKKKKIMSNVHLNQKKKKKKRRRRQRPRGRKKKTMKKSNVWTKLMCKCTKAFLSIKQSHFLPSVFSPFWGEKLFGGFGEKTHGPYHLFSFLLTQPNKLQKSFPSHFLFKVFPPPYFTSKQAHP